MIPQDQVPKTVHTADGVSTAFTYTFYAPDPANVFVEIGGTRVESGYTVYKTSDTMGYVTFDTAPESGSIITIYRSTPMTQTTDWQEGQAFDAWTIMSAFDKQTMIAQELRGGTVNVPGTVVTADSANSATRAGSATSAGRATSAGSATSAGKATRADSAGYAPYTGPFAASEGGGYAQSSFFGISAGCVISGGSEYEVGSSGSILVPRGATMYLVGSSGAGGMTFSYTTNPPAAAADQFVTRIANYDNSAKVTQFQYGDIRLCDGGGGGGSPQYAESAGYADSAGLAYDVTDDVKNGIIDSAGGGGGMMFPNYGGLTTAAQVIVSSSGEPYSATTNLDFNTTYYATDNGFLRISLKNANRTGCLRVDIGTSTIELADVRSSTDSSGIAGLTFPNIAIPSGASFRVYDGINAGSTPPGDVLIKFDHSVSLTALNNN